MVRRRNKKGTIQDLMVIVITLVIVGMMFLFYGKFMDAFNSEIQSNDKIPADAKDAIQRVDDLTGSSIDNSFLFLTIGLAFVALMLAFMVVVHPVFFVLYFIVLMVVIYVSGIASNIYQEAASNPAMVAIAQELVFTNHILTYLPFITGILGFILAIVMYKVRSNFTQ